MTGSYTPDRAPADSAAAAADTSVCLSGAPARRVRAGSPQEAEASPRPPTTQASTGGVNGPFRTSCGAARRMAGQRSSARITLRSRRPHQRHPLAVQAPIHHPMSMIADESLMPNLAFVFIPLPDVGMGTWRTGPPPRRRVAGTRRQDRKTSDAGGRLQSLLRVILRCAAPFGQ